MSTVKGSTLLLAAIVAIAILLVVYVSHLAKKGNISRFNAGPYNMQLYDAPYFYPYYEASSALRWDANEKCAAYCAQSPCTVWCR